jgi:hypothetical protein
MGSGRWWRVETREADRLRVERIKRIRIANNDFDSDPIMRCKGFWSR